MECHNGFDITFYVEDFGFVLFFFVMFCTDLEFMGLITKQANPRTGLSSNHPFSWPLSLAVSFKGERKKRDHYQDDYPPGNQHIPPWEKENHLQNAIFGGYVSSLEGTFFRIGNPSLDVLLEYLITRCFTLQLRHGMTRHQIHGAPPMFLLVFRQEMGVSKNRGKTPKMDGL